MKVYFDNDGHLVVEATDNTEMVALRAWSKSEVVAIINYKGHFKQAKNMLRDYSAKDA
jgi:hypothetical protein